MTAASRVEWSATLRAVGFALQVGVDAQDFAARAAQNRFFVPFVFRPDGRRMASKFVMAFFAGIVLATTFHLDGNYIGWTMPVLTARGNVEVNATDTETIGSHYKMKDTRQRPARHAKTNVGEPATFCLRPNLTPKDLEE